MKLSRIRPLGVFVLLISTAAAAAPRTGTLEGVVLDAKGTPVPGASVTLQTSYGSHPHAARADSHGHFQFLRFERGQYDLRAFSNGNSSDWLQRVLVRAGKTTEVTLRLNQ